MPSLAIFRSISVELGFKLGHLQILSLLAGFRLPEAKYFFEVTRSPANYQTNDLDLKPKETLNRNMKKRVILLMLKSHACRKLWFKRKPLQR